MAMLDYQRLQVASPPVVFVVTDPI
jgi:hypothetical protein